MSALNFPASPALNQIYSANGYNWIWDGLTWSSIPSINGGSINNTTIGTITPAAGAFTTLSATSGLNMNQSGVTGVTSLNSGQLAGFRNKVINGAMNIDQANAGGTVTVNAYSEFHSLDQWAALGTASAGVFTMQQNTSSPPSGFTNFLRVKTTTADASPAAAAIYAMYMQMEGQNMIDLSFGTSSALPIVLSFHARSSLTGTFGGSLLDNGSDRSYPFSYSIPTANTWYYITVAIPGDILGTWPTGNGRWGYLVLNVGCGSSALGAAGAWVTTSFPGYYGVTGNVNVISTLNATLDFTGVQLEVGSSATPFENRLFGTELSLCQRYYALTFPVGTAPAQNAGPSGNHEYPASVAGAGTNFSTFITWPVRMRTTPSITTYSPSAASAQAWDLSAAVACSAATPNNVGERGMRFSCTGNTSTVAGNLLQIHWVADARF